MEKPYRLKENNCDDYVHLLVQIRSIIRLGCICEQRRSGSACRWTYEFHDKSIPRCYKSIVDEVHRSLRFDKESPTRLHGPNKDLRFAF